MFCNSAGCLKKQVLQLLNHVQAAMHRLVHLYNYEYFAFLSMTSHYKTSKISGNSPLSSISVGNRSRFTMLMNFRNLFCIT